MGKAGTRFGRNVPIEHTHPDNDWAILKPNPRTVSRELLTRHEFQPVEGLNLLAASWLQFMVRDWMSHGKGEMDDSAWKLKRERGDDWPDDEVLVPRTPRNSEGPPPTYANQETHWWDASQIYGSTREFQNRVRTEEDGKLHVGLGSMSSAGKTEKDPIDEPGFWIGLAMLHTLFAMEHNAICDRLRAEYPSWSDDDLFEHARLINAALLAKIHVTEWSTAILGHPTTKLALRTNWWGLATERIHKLLGRISESEVWSDISGSKTNHFDVPYAITEEFVAVYRMHPLIPDDIDFRSASSEPPFEERPVPFTEVVNQKAVDLMQEIRMRDLFYSFGISHPGQIRLHNFPRSLQRFERPGGGCMDLAATDIMRTRELGVPRYNEFRRLLRLPAPKTFEELTDNAAWARELRRVYNDDIESVDLMIGMYAEPFPKDFGFSETAFRIFILMASQRLNSDRFFTTDYNPRVSTPRPASIGSPTTTSRPSCSDISPASSRRSAASITPSSPGRRREDPKQAHKDERLGRTHERRNREMQIADGVYSMGNEKGGWVRAFLLDDGTDLTLIDTLFETDARLVLDQIGCTNKTVAA